MSCLLYVFACIEAINVPF